MAAVGEFKLLLRERILLPTELVLEVFKLLDLCSPSSVMSRQSPRAHGQKSPYAGVLCT